MTTNGTNSSAWNWWRFGVDVLVAAATFIVVLAAIDASADGFQTLLLPIALIGAGLALEPNVTAQSSSTASEARSMQLPAGIVEATSA
jgi:hypothetical protein